jgi:hypothetical protein
MDFISDIVLRVRGLIDEPAIITIIWALLGLVAWISKKRVDSPEEKRFLLWAVLVMGLVLYPATMGLSMWDPYRYGYTPVGLLMVVGLLALWAAKQAYWMTTVMLTAATLAFIFGLKTSTNYWDYLIDPLVVVYSCFALLRLGYKKAYSGRSPASLGRAR